MSAYRLPEIKPVNRQQGGDSVELARAWGEINYGAPNKKKAKSSLEDGSDMDYNFLAASSLAAWMNVASLMNDDQGDDDEDGRPKLRIAGHLVSEETDNRPARKSEEEPNAALINVTKALSSARDGADDALTKAWLAAAATNSGDSLSEEQIQFLLAKRNQAAEEEPPPPSRAASEAQALVGASVAAASSSAAVAQPPPPAEDPVEQTERAITASIADSERQQKEASQRSSRVAASIAAFAASAAATAAAATNAEKKRAAERRKLQQAQAEKTKKEAPPPQVEEKLETPAHEEARGDDSVLHSFSMSAKGQKKTQPGEPQEPRQKIIDTQGLVYLGHLPKGAGASEVQEALEQFGRIASIDVSTSSRWALAKFADINDSFKAVGRLSRQGELFGARIEVRLGTAKDVARARGELQESDEMYDPEEPTDSDRRGQHDDRDRRDRSDGYDNRKRDDEDEYGRSKKRPRDDSRDRRQDRGRSAPPQDKAMDAKTKTTETFRELFNAERSRVQKKLAKGAQNVSSAKKEDDYEYYSYSDDDRAPRNPRKGKGKGKAKTSASIRIPAHIKLLGPEPEYSYYSDSDIDDDGNVIRRSAPAPAGSTRSDEKGGARQVRVRGCWSEYLLPDNRSYW
eukprot:CAMPEP_0169265644 /NCGR_PEP_ID=MMETSP1016-20121227/45890_1 /TAXON_ID=342587 /ORGANISM="Karlodinium micrum, Strain CCMP2283" /LENGTH=627 /DNA_ID=CAMNT_0009349329 /DNA_START=6 /DNA_END=1886 /DNA_ORIENTATION=-